MADYLKLFHARRLTMNEPEHAEFIKGRLAQLKIEDPVGYRDFSEHYGVDIEVKVKPKKKKVAKKTTKKS